MPELSANLLRQIAEALPDGDLRDEITAMLPYLPEQLFGARATHPDYGDVLVISAHANRDGNVQVAVIDDEACTYGSLAFRFPLNELTFTPPADAKPRVIETVEELEDLDPYDVIAYRTSEDYDLVCTAYDATTGHADYTLPVAIVCSHDTTMSALRALNKEKP